jgi:hypothetical protein
MRIAMACAPARAHCSVSGKRHLVLFGPSNGGLQNDDWKSTQQATVQNSGYAPPKETEAAILATLQPGNYTVIVRGMNNTTGVALVEVYHLDANQTAVALI